MVEFIVDHDFMLYIECDLDFSYVLVPSFQQVCLTWHR